MLTKLPGGRDDKEEESTAGKERERRPQRRTIPPKPPHPTPPPPPQGIHWFLPALASGWGRGLEDFTGRCGGGRPSHRDQN